MNPIVFEVTEKIIKRSQRSRAAYLKRLDESSIHFPLRKSLDCTSFAHGVAACPAEEKDRLRSMESANIGIVSAYNEMLSAHQPFERFPKIIKDTALNIGATAQFAGGVPAMCDGITQGELGMELSLFSRDQIAMSAAIALSHNMFDAAMYLGVCDKIVPGLLIGALRFGHLPSIFVPAGPMPSGISNTEKAKVRQLYAEGKVGRNELLESESRSYHSPGTCTFYGTANSNQMLMEFMGLHLPGSSFVNPQDDMRDKLTKEAVKQVLKLTKTNGDYMPIGKIIDERAIVNGMVGLLATGGSTNLTIHMITIARAAGIKIHWEDLAELSKVVPLLARIYPNGQADVNQFHAAGGLGYVIKELLNAGILYEGVNTVVGHGLRHYTNEPFSDGDGLIWKKGPEGSLDEKIVRPYKEPFSQEGGLQVLKGNLGTSVIKTSSVPQDRMIIEAPAMIFDDQLEVKQAFDAGELNKDFFAVVRFQGPSANGMPELHKLTAPLSVLQAKGHKVALLTDGRMSGASGKIPAAIHNSPEALQGGPISKIKNGDVIHLDALKGELNVMVSKEEWDERKPAHLESYKDQFGMGRELFKSMRQTISPPEEGATVFEFEH